MKTLSIATLTYLFLLGLVIGYLTACSPQQGDVGSSGPSGGKGDPGVAAPAPIINSAPATALQCPTGGQVITVTSFSGAVPATSTLVLCNGAQGTAGNDGSNGANGHDGVDATPVTVVNLCPGTPVYPSVFVEIAFCIDNQLYGTYSANGGFSTLMPPGGYSSNAIGSSCNFTVASNCVITH